MKTSSARVHIINGHSNLISVPNGTLLCHGHQLGYILPGWTREDESVYMEIVTWDEYTRMLVGYPHLIWGLSINRLSCFRINGQICIAVVQDILSIHQIQLHQGGAVTNFSCAGKDIRFNLQTNINSVWQLAIHTGLNVPENSCCRNSPCSISCTLKSHKSLIYCVIHSTCCTWVWSTLYSKLSQGHQFDSFAIRLWKLARQEHKCGERMTTVVKGFLPQVDYLIIFKQIHVPTKYIIAKVRHLVCNSPTPYLWINDGHACFGIKCGPLYQQGGFQQIHSIVWPLFNDLRPMIQALSICIESESSPHKYPKQPDSILNLKWKLNLMVSCCVGRTIF